MTFEHPHDAAMAGMRDGILGSPPRHVGNFCEVYERGYVLGGGERRRREKLMKRGTKVSYRSIDGQVYEGVLFCDVRADGTVGVDVDVPTCKDNPLSLTRVNWSDAPSDKSYTAWPREGA